MTNRLESLSDRQVAGALALLKDSDTVELKLTVPDDQHRSVIKALAIDPLDAQIRQVFFFDTPDLALYRGGVVLRARRIQGRAGDSVVKLRPVEPSGLPKKLRRSPRFGIEVDAMPGGFVCSGSLKGVVQNGVLREVASGQTSLKKMLTKEQTQFYKDHAPQSLSLNQLVLLGAIVVLRLKWAPEKRMRPMVGELWLYPDGSRVLELSSKCLPNQAFQVAAETRAFLSERGIDTSGVQETKTKRALEFFAKEWADNPLPASAS